MNIVSKLVDQIGLEKTMDHLSMHQRSIMHYIKGIRKPRAKTEKMASYLIRDIEPSCQINDYGDLIIYKGNASMIIAKEHIDIIKKEIL